MMIDWFDNKLETTWQKMVTLAIVLPALQILQQHEDKNIP